MKSLLAAVAAVLFLLPAAHAQEAERAGTVVDGTTNSPLAGVTVTVGDKRNLDLFIYQCLAGRIPR